MLRRPLESTKIKKPDPASFLMAAQKLGVEPAACVVIEDSKNGVIAGKNAGMYVFGVRAGNRHPQDISSAHEMRYLAEGSMALLDRVADDDQAREVDGANNLLLAS